jgi:hypothetical protein
VKYAKRPLKAEYLIRSSRRGNVEVFKVLVEHGLKPSDKHLLEAVTHRHAPLVKYLLSRGIRPNNQAVRRAAGIVPPSLVSAPRGVDRPILRMLKQAGAVAPDAKVAKIMASL